MGPAIESRDEYGVPRLTRELCFGTSWAYHSLDLGGSDKFMGYFKVDLEKA